METTHFSWHSAPPQAKLSEDAKLTITLVECTSNLSSLRAGPETWGDIQSAPLQDLIRCNIYGLFGDREFTCAVIASIEEVFQPNWRAAVKDVLNHLCRVNWDRQAGLTAIP